MLCEAVKKMAASKPFGMALREAIAGKRMSEAAYARKIGMSATYLSRVLNDPKYRPEPETVARFADGLDLAAETVAGWTDIADVLGAALVDPAPAPVQLPLSDPDEQFDAEGIVAYVESRPGVRFQERLRVRRERYSRDAYVRFCVSLFRAWSSNSHLALDAAEMSEQSR